MFDIFKLFNSLTAGLTITSIIVGIILMAIVPSIGKVLASTWEGVISFLKPVLGGLGEGLVFLVKEFVQGIKVCLSNLSTLTVIIAAIIGGGWYFRTWNDAHIKAPLEKQIVELQKKVAECKKPQTTVKKRFR